MRLVPRALRGLAIGLAGLLLAGCADGPVQTGMPQIGNSFQASMLNYIAARGGMLTEVRGPGFPQERSRLEAVITDSLAATQPGPPMPFFTEAPEGYSSRMRTVVLLNPQRSFTPAGACRDDITLPATAEGPGLRTIVALCRGEKAVNTISGRAPRADGAAHPDVARLFRQIGFDVYRVDASDRGDRGDFIPG